LGIYEKLTVDSLTGGKRFAVTGTIDKKGVVGEIGGIKQKIFGAIGVGDNYLLLPKGNCDEALDVDQDQLRLIPVGSLHEAISYMKIIAGDGSQNSLPSCVR
jgi:PDZ domain-containing protein